MVGDGAAVLYVRTYAEVRDGLLNRARAARNPMDFVPVEAARSVFERLDTLDRERWAQAFSAAAEPHFAAGLKAEEAGDAAAARREYLAAFGLFRVARYPAPNSPAKKLAYRRSQEAYFKAAAFAEPRVERVAMPYVGGQARGATIVGYLHRPRRDGALGIVVQWGGIDLFKEDRKPEPYLAAGLAVLAMDMPGVGDAPIPGSENGEELWNGVFDWIAAAPGLDERRIAVVGASTGGYWATKLAHTHRDRIAAAVNHGGPAHLAFQADWIARAARGEYPFRAGRDPRLRLRPRHRGGMARLRAAPVAARSGHPRSAVGTAFVRQRRRRLHLPDRGHALAAASRQRQIGPLLPGRPYGPRPESISDDRQLDNTGTVAHLIRPRRAQRSS